jgi:hypothetical protein
MEQENTPVSLSSPSLFKGAIEPGLITSAVLIIFTMVLYVAGLHTIKELGYIGTLLVLGAQINYGQKFRKKEMNNNMSFGQAFRFGLSMALIIALVTSVFNFFYFEFIAPEIIDMAAEKSYEDMVKGGLNEEQAANQMAKFVMPWMNSWVFAITGIFVTLIFGLLTALVAAAFVKRESTSI